MPVFPYRSYLINGVTGRFSVENKVSVLLPHPGYEMIIGGTPDTIGERVRNRVMIVEFQQRVQANLGLPLFP